MSQPPVILGADGRYRCHGLIFNERSQRWLLDRPDLLDRVNALLDKSTPDSDPRTLPADQQQATPGTAR